MGSLFFSSFLEILKQTFKIFFKNGKLMPSITLVSFIANSIILLSYFYFLNLVFTDYTTELTDLTLGFTTTDNPSLDAINSFSENFNAIMKHELSLFIVVNFVYVFAFCSTFFFVTIATVLVSANNFGGKQLNAKELVSMVGKSWRRMLVTFAYTALLGVGYTFVVVVYVVLPIQVIFFGIPYLSLPFATKAVLALAAFLYLYLSVVWTLALVVSVLEEKRGFEALSKAAKLASGLRLKGFLLKLLFGGFSFVAYQAYSTTVSQEVDLKSAIKVNMLPFILLLVVTTFVTAFSLISYTVLYFEGKKINTDDVIEMKSVTVEYTKLPAFTPISS